MALLEIEDLRVAFPGPVDRVYAVNGVSLAPEPGRPLALLGESGSRKSVTARTVMGLLDTPPARIAGSVRLRAPAGRTRRGLHVHRPRPARGAPHLPRVAVMYLGELVETGPETDLYDAARHPYTKALLAAVPVPDAIGREQRQRILLAGDPPGPVNPPSGGRFRTRCWQATDACATVQPPLTGDDHPVARHYPLAA